MKHNYCRFRDRIVGIEEVYELKDGIQVNKPGVVERYRELGKSNQLFCVCGCGRNLILRAGERNLRKQHFSYKKGELKRIEIPCRAIEEREETRRSKEVLYLWLKDKLSLNDEDIQKYILVSKEKEEKNYEYTYYIPKYQIGMYYERDKHSLKDLKVEKVATYAKKCIYVNDICNRGCVGQYPEWLIKIQKIQGYAIFLNAVERKFEKSTITTICYREKENGHWEDIIITSGSLQFYKTDKDGNLYFKDETIEKHKEDRLKEKQKEEERKREEIRKRLERERENKEKRRLELNQSLLEKNPAYESVYRILQSIHSIEGDFLDRQGNGEVKIRKHSYEIKNLRLQIDKHRIHAGNFVIYLEDNPESNYKREQLSYLVFSPKDNIVEILKKNYKLS